ncbi:hypothetical protein BC828DRAFT_376079 [Blastocladiella britannica]|nr:hypothetical protein BC828DRAFT_376079 [Blastocladiella britannica]
MLYLHALVAAIGPNCPSTEPIIIASLSHDNDPAHTLRAGINESVELALPEKCPPQQQLTIECVDGALNALIGGCGVSLDPLLKAPEMLFDSRILLYRRDGVPSGYEIQLRLLVNGDPEPVRSPFLRDVPNEKNPHSTCSQILDGEPMEAPPGYIDVTMTAAGPTKSAIFAAPQPFPVAATAAAGPSSAAYPPQMQPAYPPQMQPGSASSCCGSSYGSRPGQFALFPAVMFSSSAGRKFERKLERFQRQAERAAAKMEHRAEKMERKIERKADKLERKAEKAARRG